MISLRNSEASLSTSDDSCSSSLRLLVKLGGAAITEKQTFETLNEPVLKKTAAALAKAVQEGSFHEISTHRV